MPQNPVLSIPGADRARTGLLNRQIIPPRPRQNAPESRAEHSWGGRGGVLNRSMRPAPPPQECLAEVSGAFLGGRGGVNIYARARATNPAPGQMNESRCRERKYMTFQQRTMKKAMFRI